MRERAPIDKNTVIVFALDIDDTTIKPFESKEGTQGSVLSETLITHLKKEIENAKEKGATVAGFVFVTLRNFTNEHQAILNKTKNPRNYFMFNIVEDLTEILELPCLGVSTPDDLADNRLFGAAYKFHAPYYADFEKSRDKYIKHENDYETIHLPVELCNYPTFFTFDTSTKSGQLKQVMTYFSQEYHRQDLVVQYYDDRRDLCVNAITMNLPSDSTEKRFLEAFHHFAPTDSEVEFLGKNKAKQIVLPLLENPFTEKKPDKTFARKQVKFAESVHREPQHAAGFSGQARRDRVAKKYLQPADKRVATAKSSASATKPRAHHPRVGFVRSAAYEELQKLNKTYKQLDPLDSMDSARFLPPVAAGQEPQRLFAQASVGAGAAAEPKPKTSVALPALTKNSKGFG